MEVLSYIALWLSLWGWKILCYFPAIKSYISNVRWDWDFSVLWGWRIGNDGFKSSAWIL